nr:MAG: hypothetical protein DIU68_17160 [Chloroflexota bacterium]
MGRRFAHPFLPALSRELAVPLASVQNVMALNAGIGLFSPLFGPLSDRYGRKPVMIGTLLLMSAAALIGALMPRFTVFAVVVLIFGLSKMIYDPAMQAAVGERVPYHRRALAIGATELSWAGSLFIVAPLAGFLLARYGIAALFLAFAALAFVSAVVVWLFLPSDQRAGTTTTTGRPAQPLWQVFREHPAARAIVGYSLLLSMANEIFFINYGAWMQDTFGLELAVLGVATTVIALAEMMGEGAVMAIADRVGKRRMALAGALLASAMYALLPPAASSLPIALGGVFLMFLGFEIAIVASIPLFTEVVPHARGVVMSSNMAAHSLGRLTGAVLGAALFRAGDSLLLTGAVAMLVGLGSAFILRRYLHEPEVEAV